MPAEGIDAVVIDLPPSRRKQAIDLVRSRFDGRLVLVLDPYDDPAAIPTRHAYTIVQRPFEIVELWHLVTTDPSWVSRDEPGTSTSGRDQGGAVGDPERPGSAERPEPVGTGTPPGSGTTAPPGAPAATGDAEDTGPGRSAADASTWKWRGRRYGPATIPSDPAGEEQSTGTPPGPRAGGPEPTAEPSTRGGPRRKLSGPPYRVSRLPAPGPARRTGPQLHRGTGRRRRRNARASRRAGAGERSHAVRPNPGPRRDRRRNRGARAAPAPVPARRRRPRHPPPGRPIQAQRPRDDRPIQAQRPAPGRPIQTRRPLPERSHPGRAREQPARVRRPSGA